MEVPFPPFTKEIGEEILVVPFPPVDATEALQSPVCAISPEVQRKFFNMFSRKEGGLRKIHELRTQQDECSKKIDALRVQKSRIVGQIGERVAESGGFDLCLFLNDQIGVLVEEKNGDAGALEHMRSEILGYVKRLLDERDEPVDSTARATLLRGRGDEC